MAEKKTARELGRTILWVGAIWVVWGILTYVRALPLLTCGRQIVAERQRMMEKHGVETKDDMLFLMLNDWSAKQEFDAKMSEDAETVAEVKESLSVADAEVRLHTFRSLDGLVEGVSLERQHPDLVLFLPSIIIALAAVGVGSLLLLQTGRTDERRMGSTRDI